MKAKLIIFSTIVLTCACGKLGPGGLKDIQTLTKTEGTIKVSSEFGYKNGSLISNKDFVNDCFILEEVTGTSSIDYYSHAYSYNREQDPTVIVGPTVAKDWKKIEL